MAGGCRFAPFQITDEPELGGSETSQRVEENLEAKRETSATAHSAFRFHPPSNGCIKLIRRVMRIMNVQLHHFFPLNGTVPFRSVQFFITKSGKKKTEQKKLSFFLLPVGNGGV